MSPPDILAANVAAIREDLQELKADYREHKADVRAALARLDGDIKNAVLKLEAEIRAAAAKAERDLRTFADQVEKQFARVDTHLAELRADNKFLRERVDNNFDRLCAKIDATNQDVKETNRAVSELTKVVLKLDSRVSALTWVGGGLVTLVTLGVTVGKAFSWF